MPKRLKLNDISKKGENQLIENDINELIPLPPPYDKIKEPAFKKLTEDQKERLAGNLDGFSALALPRPRSKKEEEKYV